MADVPPPLFAPSKGGATASSKSNGQQKLMNLDDIFGDVMFTPDGETVFMSEEVAAGRVSHSGEGKDIKINASVLMEDGQYKTHMAGGGVATTQMLDPSNISSTMGNAATQSVPTSQSVPFQRAPQARNHVQYSAPRKKKKGSKDRKMSDQQKTERRERNKEHAKRSRIRKKFLLESLQQSVALLKEENEKLKQSLKQHLGEEKGNLLIAGNESSNGGNEGLLASSQGIANKVLDDPDFSFIKALQTAQQNFVVTDPAMPDNPIVYASQGFLNLTGYSVDQILGRNCRFLQGPETDPKAVDRIRKAIIGGNDMSVCLLNYRVDGLTFWNQFFIAALRDAAGNVTNFVGVQCKVSDHYAATVTKQQQEEEEDMGEEAQ